MSESTSADAQLAVIQRSFMCMLPLRCPRYLTLFVCATSFRALTERIQVLEDKKGNVAAERIALERKLETERANQEDIFEYLRGEIHNKNNQITELQVMKQESLGHLPNSNELQSLKHLLVTLSSSRTGKESGTSRGARAHVSRA